MCVEWAVLVQFSRIHWTLLTIAKTWLEALKGQEVAVSNAFGGQNIPSYGLYGEPLHSSPVLMHIEPIKARSRALNGEIDVHLHQNLNQIVWLTSGQLAVHVNGHRRTLSGPAAAVVPALAVHSFLASPNADGFVLTISLEFAHCSESKVASEVFKRLFASPAVFTLAQQPDSTADIEGMFNMLNREYETRHERSDLIIDRVAKTIFLLLARQTAIPLGDSSAASPNAELAKFLTLVDRYFSADFSLVEYAKHMNCQVERLIRIIRKGTGKSPMQVVQERRLREACHRLTHMKTSISDISVEVGFNDVAYFCRFFKKRIGSTPSQYRASAAKNRDA